MLFDKVFIVINYNIFIKRGIEIWKNSMFCKFKKKKYYKVFKKKYVYFFLKI